MKIFEFKPIDSDDDSEIILKGMKDIVKYLAEMNIDFNVENEGIGAYEYGSCKEIDHGIDYIEIESHEDLKLIVIGNNNFKDEISLRKFAHDIIDNIAHTRCLVRGNLEQTITLEITNSTFADNNSTLTCDLSWTEI